jgi:integrase/recombinase XerD
MPVKLSTTVKNITSIPNLTNASLVREFHEYMKSIGVSENYQNGNLKILIYLAIFLGPDTDFYIINRKEQILAFLNIRIKDSVADPDKRWIRTWNDYLQRIKYFFRWLLNCKQKASNGEEVLPNSDWITPAFVQIKEKRTKRLSPYLESELRERDDILTIIKYEPYRRNKAALSLLWDLDARNHEVTLLQIKHIRLKERYGEGEIPHQSKTGAGPLLLRCSFPYVRDWINEHPFKNEPNARLICNLLTGGPITPDTLRTIMIDLKRRIIRLLLTDSITDEKERLALEHLIKTKRWNPYCIRHSAITYDSDFLPEYALKKKARWSMNSKQGARYIKTRMGNDLKNQILLRDGIITEESVTAQRKPSVLACPRCNLVNASENKYCSSCSYPLVPSAFEEIKEAENRNIQTLQQKYELEMKAMREQMNHILSLIQQNPVLAQVKPDTLLKQMESNMLT